MASRGKEYTTVEEFEHCAEMLKLAQEQLDSLLRAMREAEVDGFDCEARTLMSQSSKLVDWSMNVRNAFAKERVPKKKPKK
jgi:hypothetical protein